LTVSGQLITKEYGVPSIQDIATGLSNIIRYNGASRVKVSVAAHSILTYNLAKEQSNDTVFLLYCLLHDAAECCIGDIPTPFKNQEILETEERILDRIVNSFGLPKISKETWSKITIYDKLSLKYEVHRLGCGGDGIKMFIPAITTEEEKIFGSAFDNLDMSNSHDWAEVYEQILRELISQVYDFSKSGV
jgi:5'-deoxynucleotidase YfbR-like HD superfamily hydrolase